MKGQKNWSYKPYKPLLTYMGDIYICRIVPYTDKIHFEWLPIDAETYSVYCRKRYTADFIHICDTKETYCDIENLSPDTNYEFYVEADGKKSRHRFARCGESIGTVVNYLHPEDSAYAFSGNYLCSPSIVKHPDGYLLASMDVFGIGTPQNLTLIFRSDDDGETWHYVSELMPCFWGKLFIHKGEIYMLGCSTEYGDLLIGKSTDGGKTFTAPVCLLRGSNGKAGKPGVQQSPENVISYKGRLWHAIEWGSWSNTDYTFASIIMSCDENDDLLDPENWSFTEPRKFAHFAPELEYLPMKAMAIEGTLAVSPDGKLLNIQRFAKEGSVLTYEVNTEDPEAIQTYYGLIDFTAGCSKFTIRQDEVSGNYYSVATRFYDTNYYARNLLSLMRSKDLVTWEVACDLYDFRDRDQKFVGLQYVDFQFDGDDIIYLCRTALNGADSFHNANYSTFHRIKNFRNI